MVSSYIINHVGQPDSLDPLDADKWQNMARARMLFLTPIEISSEDTLESTILSSFSYEGATSTMLWEVKEGILYSDGTTVTPRDVILPILRMLRQMPHFPVIKNIKGVEAWRKKGSQLTKYPEGISLSQNIIKIKFDRDVAQPFFRFSLELFSIIPERCVDLNTSKLNCEVVPTSGHYTYKKGEKLSFIKFREGTSSLKESPREINFKYASKEELLRVESLSKTDVIVSREDLFSQEELNQLENRFNVKYLPASSIGVFQINSAIEPFDDQKCRFLFSKTLRSIYEELKESSVSASSSLFTPLLPGYLRDSDFAQAPNDNECFDKISNADLQWHFSEKDVPSDLVRAIDKTVRFFGIKKFQKVLVKTKGEMFQALDDQKSFMLYFSTGFWPVDPVNDLQMLFTPNLHKDMNYITLDKNLRKLLDVNLEGARDKTERRKVLEKINRYIYDDSKINVFNHVRGFYLYGKNLDHTKLPTSIKDVSGAPWQVFPSL